MAEGQVVRFRIGEGFPHEERLARWVTVCAMALNDLVLVNRWLIPRLAEEIESETHENVYLGRVAAAHLFEAATFLRKTDRQVTEIRDFVTELGKEARDAHERLIAIGDGGTTEFAKDLKHARNKSFHYDALVLGEGEDYEALKGAMKAFADDEDQRDVRLGEIRDIPPLIEGFRAVFADDIAVEMSLRVKEDGRLADFLTQVSEHISDYLVFAKAALNQYVTSQPQETWEIEGV